MSRSLHATLYRIFDRELSELLDTVLAGDVVADREIAERLVSAIGALVRLHAQHPVDAHGRCATCRPPRRLRWWWRRRAACSVHVALSRFLRRHSDSGLSVPTETESPGAVR